MSNYIFGEEPSQIARTALSYFQAFGGQAQGALALDLGCGEGRDTAYLAAAGMHVTARDVAPSGLEKLHSLFEKRHLSLEKVDYGAEDAREFHYPLAAYDITLAANVFQFVGPEEAPRLIKCLGETTKVNGICAVGVFSAAMRAWGAEIDGLYAATPDELMAFFRDEDGWQLLDRTEYWSYRPQDHSMAAFTYVVVRKVNL